MLPLHTMFLLDFKTVSTVWSFALFYSCFFIYVSLSFSFYFVLFFRFFFFILFFFISEILNYNSNVYVFSLCKWKAKPWKRRWVKT
jgi:hypothetical protein